MGLSPNEIIMTVFWDARGVIHIYYPQNGRTLNGGYYAYLIDRFFFNVSLGGHLMKWVTKCSLIRFILRIECLVTILSFQT